MMEAVSDLEDAEYKLLSSNEVCITNHNTCNIYTIHGTYKFHYEFDDELYEVLPGGSGLNYTFLLNGVTEQVRLK